MKLQRVECGRYGPSRSPPPPRGRGRGL